MCRGLRVQILADIIFEVTGLVVELVGVVMHLSGVDGLLVGMNLRR